MSAADYAIITARRASDLIYEIAAQARKGIWIVPDNVCPAVPLALACGGAKFRFVDIDAKTLCLDTQQVAKLSASYDIAGVVYVRTFGFNGAAQNDLTTLRAVLPKAIIIDDCCIGVPHMRPPPTGDSADAILFSTGYGKVLDLDGGAFGFVKKGFMEKGFANKDFFKEPKDIDVSGFGLNDQVFEALLAKSNSALKTGDSVFVDYDFLVEKCGQNVKKVRPSWSHLSQMIQEKLPARLAHKERLNGIYTQGLAAFSPRGSGYQKWRFHIFLQNPEQTLAALFGAGLFASRHYAPVSVLWGAKPGDNSRKMAESIINLFNDQYFNVKQAHQTVDIINEVGKPLNR